MRRKLQIPAEIEDHRDERWCREATRQIETAFDAERFIDEVERRYSDLRVLDGEIARWWET